MSSTPRKFPSTVRWILWAALSGSVVMYLIIVPLIAPEEGREAELPAPREAFYLIGIVFFGVAQGVRILANRIRTPEGRAKVPAWIDVAFIVALAQTEAVAIFGLFLGIFGVPLLGCLPLFGIAGLGMLLLNPHSFFAIERSVD